MSDQNQQIKKSETQEEGEALQQKKEKEISPSSMLDSFNKLHPNHPDNHQNQHPELKYSPKQIDAFIRDQEVGDAELYIDTFRNKFAYDHISKDWYYWNENYWRIDIIGERFAAVKELRKTYSLAKHQAIFAEKSAEKNKKQDEADLNRVRIRLLTERIVKLGESPYYSRVINTASNGLGSLGIPGDNWDKKTKILVVKNGCIDLSTGRFTDGNPTDYMRTHCPVELSKTKSEDNIKLWNDFLLSSQDGDTDVVRFIQKLIGYSVLGTCERHIFPVFYGVHGRNGKSTMFEILKEALGSQMCKLPNDFLIKKKAQKPDGAADSVLMGLQGKKIVWCSEIDKGDQIDLPKVKGLTGGDTITARGNWAKHQIEFQPTFTSFMLTNRLAHVDASDEAFWQRCFVIPFGLSFVQEPKKDYERKVDLNLKDKLQRVLPDIIRWVVEGSLLYQHEGLFPLPEAVLSATKKYRLGEDRVGEFLREYYEKTDKLSGFALRSEMYDFYKAWAKDSGYTKKGKKSFFEDITRRFGEPVREATGFGFRGLFKKSAIDI